MQCYRIEDTISIDLGAGMSAMLTMTTL